MKKEPLLTNFPRTIFASATRQLQASLRSMKQSVSKESLSGYETLFAEIISPDFLARIDTTKRHRHYGSIVVFWCWIAQILDGNTSCAKAVSRLQGWLQSCGLPVPSSDTSSYCKGRIRLPESFIRKASSQVQSYLKRSISPADLWQGMTLKAIDGSSVKLEDTLENQEEFPQPSTQKSGCGFPVMGITGLLNLSHGGWDAFCCAKQSTHDSTMAWDLMEHLESGDLLLADRAYCSYAYIASLLEKGVHSLMRLHQKREAGLDWNQGKKISSCERIVTWKRPAYNKQNKEFSQEAWNQLPQEMTIRLIRLAYEDRSGQKKWMIVATTLTDHKRYDGVELHALYAKRWEIELKLRDIKTSMGFEMMQVKTPQMALKTLSMLQLSYNLVRALMKQAAHHHGLEKDNISFKECLGFITVSVL